jgi:flagellar L-ring protein precursor FlgH
MEKWKMNRPFSSIFNSTTLVALLVGFELTTHMGSLVADSLWKEDPPVSALRGADGMFSDKKARRVGDIITVLIQENNSGSRNNNTATSKQTGVDASITSFLYGPTASGLLTKKGQYPAMNFNSKNTFTGGGQINNSEIITAQAAVRVVDVLPNGNMVVEGRRQTAFAGERQDSVLRGTIRFDDISSSNTVYSFNISDASIQFISHGVITDNQKKGWFNTIWDKVSPF